MRAMYTARAVRDGGWWAIDFPGLRHVFSQARRLDKVEYMARDVIALVLEVPVDSFDVRVVVELEGRAREVVDTASAARARAEEAQREASERLREAVATLLASGLTIRDVGQLLGVSHQRIAQLAPQRVVRPVRAADASVARRVPFAASGRG